MKLSIILQLWLNIVIKQDFWKNLETNSISYNTKNKILFYRYKWSNKHNDKIYIIKYDKKKKNRKFNNYKNIWSKVIKTCS